MPQPVVFFVTTAAVFCVALLQLRGLAWYVLNPTDPLRYESIAFVALVGLWSGPIWLALLGYCAIVWRRLPTSKKLLGGGTSVLVLLMSVLSLAFNNVA